MPDAIRKRHENGRRYGAALASWRASSTCPVCRDAGTILYEEGERPCPYCDPAGARRDAETQKL